MRAVHAAEASWTVPDRHSGRLEEHIPPHPQHNSLILTRTLSAELGTQTHLPTRFLHGLLPSCLLEEYEFWQHSAESGSAIIGYPTDLSAFNLYILRIELIKDAGIGRWMIYQYRGRRAKN
jgi:hypothetical protein